jgi:CRISPR-associated protein Csx1
MSENLEGLGSGRTLVIAPWGQPASWRNVSYILENIKVESCTSLMAVVQHFGNDTDVAILTLDSLLDEYIKETKSRCYECYNRHRDLVKKSANAKTYEELLNILQGFVKEFIRCLNLACDPFVVICPSIGSPGGNWNFIGASSDFEAVALYELGKKCIQTPYTRIFLDLSHGINFMPAVTLKLASELVSLILAAHGGAMGELANGVELSVYNSDPSRVDNGVQQLKLNIVVRERIRTILSPHQLSPKLLDTKKENLLTARDSINAAYLDMVRLPLSAIHYPLPLALCETIFLIGNSSLPLQLLDKAFNLWHENISIGNKSVERLVKLDPDAVYALLLTEAIRRRLEEVEKPPHLEDIKKLAKFYKFVNESFYYLIMNEISDIERRLGSFENSGWLPLSRLFGEEERKMSPDKRVMIAHAGLQKELVEINVDTRRLRNRTDVKDILTKAGLRLRST